MKTNKRSINKAVRIHKKWFKAKEFFFGAGRQHEQPILQCSHDALIFKSVLTKASRVNTCVQETRAFQVGLNEFLFAVSTENLGRVLAVSPTTSLYGRGFFLMYND